MRSIILLNYDEALTKKTFANLDTLGSIAAHGYHCFMDGCSKKGDTGVVTTTGKDF